VKDHNSRILSILVPSKSPIDEGFINCPFQWGRLCRNSFPLPTLSHNRPWVVVKHCILLIQIQKTSFHILIMGDNHNHYILCCNTTPLVSFLFNTLEPCFNNNMITLLQVDVMPTCMLWIAITFKLDSRITNCHDSINSTPPHSNVFWSHKLNFDIVRHIELGISC
jgi:hypothetical protein